MSVYPSNASLHRVSKYEKNTSSVYADHIYESVSEEIPYLEELDFSGRPIENNILIEEYNAYIAFSVIQDYQRQHRAPVLKDDHCVELSSALVFAMFNQRDTVRHPIPSVVKCEAVLKNNVQMTEPVSILEQRKDDPTAQSRQRQSERIKNIKDRRGDCGIDVQQTKTKERRRERALLPKWTPTPTLKTARKQGSWIHLTKGSPIFLKTLTA